MGFHCPITQHGNKTISEDHCVTHNNFNCLTVIKKYLVIEHLI